MWLNTVKNLYNRYVSFKEVPLFDEKSGTLRLEKRHFSIREAAVFFVREHNMLIDRSIQEIGRRCDFFLQNELFFMPFKPLGEQAVLGTYHCTE